MDPVTGAAAITAGAALLQGLLAQQAAKKERERQGILEAQKMGFQSQMEGQKNATAGTNNALAQLMQQFSSFA